MKTSLLPSWMSLVALVIVLAAFAASSPAQAPPAAPATQPAAAQTTQPAIDEAAQPADDEGPPPAVEATTRPPAKKPPLLSAAGEKDRLNLLRAKKFEPIPKVEFEDTDLRNVLKMVADATSLNIMVSPTVSGAVGIYATDIDPIDLLERAITAAGAALYVKDQVVHVVTWDEYRDQFGLTKEVIQPKYLDVEALAEVIKPFLTDRGVAMPAPQSGAVVVLELPAALARLQEMIQALDVPGLDPVVRVIRLKHASAKDLAEILTNIFQDSRESRTSAAASQPAAAARLPAPAAPGGDRRGVVVPPVAPRDLAAGKARGPSRTGPSAASASRPLGAKVVLYAEERTNSLLVKAYKNELALIEKLVEELDIEKLPTPSNVHVYRLENTSASSVASVIVDLLKGSSDNVTRGAARAGLPPPLGIRTIGSLTPGLGLVNPSSGGLGSLNHGGMGNSASGGGGSYGGAGGTPPPQLTPTGPGSANARQGEAGGQAGATVAEVTVTVNDETNTVIIRATPDQQRDFARLIEDLDRPRPQVMIEAILVQVTTSDNFELGIELEAADIGKTSYRLLSEFGLSTVDPTTGKRVVIPSNGGNAVIIRPDFIPLVLKAFQEATNARISSAPRLLVNDNATGTIESVTEQPFTSTNLVEATVATTSFAGYAQAGTTLTVIPHISDSNFIRLQYQMILNSFLTDTSTGATTAAQGIPPPRATNTVTSEAVVPDGHVIIVGGLRSRNENRDRKSVPLLGDIPLLGYAFQSNAIKKDYSTLFVFIRPTILRDRQFETLRYLSSRDARRAEIPGEFPANEIRTIGRPAPKK